MMRFWPFGKHRGPAAGGPLRPSARALIKVGTALGYLSSDVTVTAIEFHWGESESEDDVVFEVEFADGRRAKDVYYHFSRPDPDPHDSVYAFSL